MIGSGGQACRCWRRSRNCAGGLVACSSPQCASRSTRLASARRRARRWKRCWRGCPRWTRRTRSSRRPCWASSKRGLWRAHCARWVTGCSARWKPTRLRRGARDAQALAHHGHRHRDAHSRRHAHHGDDAAHASGADAGRRINDEWTTSAGALCGRRGWEK